MVLPEPVSPTIAVRVPAGDLEVDVAQRPGVARRSGTQTSSKRTSPRDRAELARAGMDVDRQVEVLEHAVEQRGRGLDVDRRR